ncbi:hypothetical protein JAAARDRAFT_290130 [Jaapia argillacea MUCL 33604]|uniref:ThuA-like domain-containing protein n=1 Tax=Jaapia argillacea MUCL 33604 TaxID=933084 RepID=A0A067PTS8_9AGAM|nr:hypothetical protein JAAARDRAFT_290130 [Jaapia argillacea MUCL 33604]
MFPSLVSVSFTAALLGFLSVATVSSADHLAGRILIYSYTDGFRHDSIPTATQALKDKGPYINVFFDSTEDKQMFNDTILSQYDAVLFLDTTGQVLDAPGEAALQKYLNLGGNFIGIHAASACEMNTSFYGKELGAYFDYHPDLTNATINVIDNTHPSTSMLPAKWHVIDEMYNFVSDPRSVGAVVVLSADESTYVDLGPRSPKQGEPHPTAWYQERGAGVQPGGTAGRSFYTSLGHLNETWKDDLFMAHVAGGITWALQSNTTKVYNSSAVVGSSMVSNFTFPTSSASSVPTSTPTGTSPSKSSAYTLLATQQWLVTACWIFIGALALRS